MPSGLENLEGNKFILRYEYPWGGIASNASKEDIQPNQFVSCDGLFIKSGRLCSTNYYAFNPTYFKYGLDGNLLYMTQPTGVDMVAVYTVNGLVVGIDRNCNTWYYDFGLLRWIPDQAAPTGVVDGQGSPIYPSYSCSQIIRGIIYIFDYFGGAQYVYTPLNSMTVGSTFVGGKYCMTLDEYLITCYTNMEVWSSGTAIDYTTTPPTDAIAPTMTGREYRPNRYNWSAAQEAYTTWNPAVLYNLAGVNIAGGDRTAGWNGIPEVQQEITGCFAMGNVGYILHDQGVTQLTPTSAAILGDTAIQPFDATLLWGGKDGIGCTMPKTLAVYGHLAIWGNNNNFNLFTGDSSPKDITEVVKHALYYDLNMFKYQDNKWSDVFGQFCNMGVDNKSPELVYNLYMVYTQPVFTNPIMMIVWSFIISTQTWTRHVVNVTEAMKSISGNENYSNVLSGSYAAVNANTFKFPSIYSQTGADFFVSPLYGGIIINTVPEGIGNADSFFLLQYINDGITSIADIPPVTNLTFRTEEFQLYRKPTIRGVILRAAGIGTLHLNFNGYNFSDIILDGTSTTKLYRSFGMYTDMAPALNINSTDFNGFITKVHVFGTYAEGEPI